jgi:hypothetical protein
MGLTGLEPVTLRLSSACSNQLSYRPGIRGCAAEFLNFDCRFSIWNKLARFARIYLNRQSQIANRKCVACRVVARRWYSALKDVRPRQGRRAYPRML